MSEVEGIGEMATGAALARAVEPRTGEAAGHTQEAHCLNCGEALVGPYCYRCGQRGHVHRTISAWWHDFLHSVLHVDGKFWLTLGMLVWRPGELTRRYAHGERAKFVSPLALFLFTVFLMFAVFSAFGGPFGTDPGGVQRGLREEARVLEQQVAELEQERSAAAALGRDTAEIDRRIEAAREEASVVRTMSEGGVPEGSAIQVSEDLPEWLQSAARRAGENPQLLFYKLQANAYKFSWALIPLSLPFVWVLFLHRQRYRREFTGYDHLVFVTYSITFMSLLLVAYAPLQALGVAGGVVGAVFLLIPPVHIYRQLRGAYGLSRLSAIWRTFVLMIFAGLALAIFLLLLLAIGVLG